MKEFEKEKSECCRFCYWNGFYAKCESKDWPYCPDKRCINKDFPLKIKRRACTCGRYRRSIGLFCFCEEHRIGFDGLDCKNKTPGEDVEIIDCADFHPNFSELQVMNHELTCYSCQREKTDGVHCLQLQWNKLNQSARDLTIEDQIEYHNHVLARKLRSGKVIQSVF